MAITLTKEEYECKKAFLAKAKRLKNEASKAISRIQKKDMDKAIELEDMIADFRMNVVKNPGVKGNNEKIEIAMIPIYETISNMVWCE